MAGVSEPRSGEEEELAAMARLDAYLDELLMKQMQQPDFGLPDSALEGREEGDG